MRSFIISLSALIVLFVFVFLNSFFVSKFSSEMKEMVDKIEDVDSTEQILEICDAWEKRKFFISLSVPHKQTDEVEKMLSILLEKSLHKAENEFFETKALLVNAISEISNHGAINLDNIL